MAIETAVKIDVDVNGIQTVQQAATVYEDLGDAVANTQREAEKLALQFGINDDRTKEAIRRAGEYKGQLELLDQAIDANRGGADQLFRSVQGLAAGFEIAAGAMAIVGTESQELEKLLIKVQGAMVLAQGLKDLNEFKGSIIGIATNIKNFLIPAFTGMRNALISTGIGAAVIAVGALVANFLRLKEASKEAAAAQKNYNDQLAGLRNEQKLILEGERAVVEENLSNTQKKLKAGQAALKEQVANDNAYFESLRKLGIDARDSEIKRRRDNIKAQQIQNEQLYLEQLKLAQRLEELKKQEAKSNTKAVTEGKKEEKQVVNEYEEWLKKERERSAKALEGVQGQQLQNLDFTISQQTQKIVDANAIIVSRATDNSVSSIDRLKMGYDLFAQDTYSTFVNIFEAIAQLELAFGNESEKSQKKAFEIRKGIALANATITSIEATINAFDTAQESPITAFFPAYPFVQAGIAAAFGIAKIQQIRNQKFQGATTPSTSPQSSPSSATSMTNSNSGSGLINVPTTRLPQSQDILTQERRVYVLEGDITRTQRRAATNQNVSVLGG
jgi:hypothetical protein